MKHNKIIKEEPVYTFIFELSVLEELMEEEKLQFLSRIDGVIQMLNSFNCGYANIFFVIGGRFIYCYSLFHSLHDIEAVNPEMPSLKKLNLRNITEDEDVVRFLLGFHAEYDDTHIDEAIVRIIDQVHDAEKRTIAFEERKGKKVHYLNEFNLVTSIVPNHLSENPLKSSYLRALYDAEDSPIYINILFFGCDEDAMKTVKYIGQNEVFSGQKCKKGIDAIFNHLEIMAKFMNIIFSNDG